jgi:hypothetical protein
MELKEVVATVGGQSRLAEAIGCNKSYVSRACKRGRAGPALAVRIYRKLGHRTGPVIDATDDQIEVMERLFVRSEAA